MATVVNNPQPTQQPAQQSSNGNGFLVGIILLILFVIIIVFYGLPYLGSMGGGTDVNVPKQIDVNVQQPQN